MEEEIKYLKSQEAYELYFRGNPKLETVVRNLINRNKELEEENKTLKNVVSEIFNSEDITENYIPKSKVIEKIEERKSWLCSNDIAYKDDYVLEVLQELLEEVGG